MKSFPLHFRLITRISVLFAVADDAQELSATFDIHAVQYVSSPFPNHPQNKCETQNKKQNCKDIEDHSKPRCNVIEPFRSFHQPYHPAPLYSIERENDLVPIEHS